MGLLDRSALRLQSVMRAHFARKRIMAMHRSAQRIQSIQRGKMGRRRAHKTAVFSGKGRPDKSYMGRSDILRVLRALRDPPWADTPSSESGDAELVAHLPNSNASVLSLVEVVASVQADGSPRMLETLDLCTAIFQLIDTNRKGVVTLFEVDYVLRRCLKQRPSSYEKQRAWEECDMDKDGVIRLPECVRFLVVGKLPHLTLLAKELVRHQQLFTAIQCTRHDACPLIRQEDFSKFLLSAGENVMSVKGVDEMFSELVSYSRRTNQETGIWRGSFLESEELALAEVHFFDFLESFLAPELASVSDLCFRKLQDLIDLFNIFDFDNSGSLDKEECRLIMSCLGQRPTDTEVDELVSLGTHSDGPDSDMVLDSGAFIRVMCSRGTRAQERLLAQITEFRAAFSVFDFCGEVDGTLDRAEVAEGLARLGLPSNDENVTDLFVVFDSNTFLETIGFPYFAKQMVVPDSEAWKAVKENLMVFRMRFSIFELLTPLNCDPATLRSGYLTLDQLLGVLPAPDLDAMDVESFRRTLEQDGMLADGLISFASFVALVCTALSANVLVILHIVEEYRQLFKRISNNSDFIDEAALLRVQDELDNVVGAHARLRRVPSRKDYMVNTKEAIEARDRKNRGVMDLTDFVQFMTEAMRGDKKNAVFTTQTHTISVCRQEIRAWEGIDPDLLDRLDRHACEAEIGHDSRSMKGAENLRLALQDAPYLKRAINSLTDVPLQVSMEVFRNVHLRYFEPGEWLFRPGDRATTLYVVLDGNLTLHTAKDTLKQSAPQLLWVEVEQSGRALMADLKALIKALVKETTPSTEKPPAKPNPLLPPQAGKPPAASRAATDPKNAVGSSVAGTYTLKRQKSFAEELRPKVVRGTKPASEMASHQLTEDYTWGRLKLLMDRLLTSVTTNLESGSRVLDMVFAELEDLSVLGMCEVWDRFSAELQEVCKEVVILREHLLLKLTIAKLLQDSLFDQKFPWSLLSFTKAVHASLSTHGKRFKDFFQHRGLGTEVAWLTAGCLPLGSMAISQQRREIKRHRYGARAETRVPVFMISAVEYLQAWRTEILSFLKEVPFIKGQPRPQLLNLAAHVVPRTVPVGEHVFRLGTKADSVFIVEEGSVKLQCPLTHCAKLLEYSGSPSTKGTVDLAVVARGDIIDVHQLSSDTSGLHQVDAIAVTQVVGYEATCEELLQCIDQARYQNLLDIRLKQRRAHVLSLLSEDPAANPPAALDEEESAVKHVELPYRPPAFEELKCKKGKPVRMNVEAMRSTYMWLPRLDRTARFQHTEKRRILCDREEVAQVLEQHAQTSPLIPQPPPRKSKQQAHGATISDFRPCDFRGRVVPDMARTQSFGSSTSRDYSCHESFSRNNRHFQRFGATTANLSSWDEQHAETHSFASSAREYCQSKFLANDRGASSSSYMSFCASTTEAAPCSEVYSRPVTHRLAHANRHSGRVRRGQAFNAVPKLVFEPR